MPKMYLFSVLPSIYLFSFYLFIYLFSRVLLYDLWDSSLIISKLTMVFFWEVTLRRCVIGSHVSRHVVSSL